MNKETLAAALNVAFYTASTDEMADAEWAVLRKELDTFNMTDEQKEAVIERFKEMDILEAINLLRTSDDATRDEAQALTIMTMLSDNEYSDMERGAFRLMNALCKFRTMEYEEARQILGF